MKKHLGFKKVLPVLTLGLILIGMAFLLQDPSISASEEYQTIGFVNIEAIFQVHPEREAAETSLQLRALQLQQEMEEKAQELDAEDQQQLLLGYQQELEQYEHELIAGIIKEIEEIVTKVAQEEGIAVVLEASHVLYGGVDLTDLVIEALMEE